MKHVTFNFKENPLKVIKTITVILLFSLTSFAQTKNNKEKFAIFSDEVPVGAQINNKDEFVRDRGSEDPSKQNNYIYVPSSNSPAEISGLSIPIRENPGVGEFRYITFAWIKWGNDLEIGMRFGHDESKAVKNGIGKKYNYTYAAGKSNKIPNALVISESGPGNWTLITRDLWKDFGDFTLTSVSFICPVERDAGFDEIFLGKSENAFTGVPKVLPTNITDKVELNDGDMSLDQEVEVSTDDGIKVDWAAQLKAGGIMMYPLYLMALMAIVIAIQRFMTSRDENLAPKKLCDSVRNNLITGNISGALEACAKYPSTLAKSISFILKHRAAGREVVSQTAGDIAARDIREHLNKIYPLSILASLAPLIGLLGTIVGMIEAFALVAAYGDEGGASILSDAISKALITTAAGLIIAAPCVALYFMLKKKIMGLASHIESEVENVINVLFLNDDSKDITSK